MPRFKENMTRTFKSIARKAETNRRGARRLLY